MAVTIANLDNNVKTSFAATTASLTWAASSRGLVVMACSTESGNTITSMSVTGGSETWTRIGSLQGYAGRRWIGVFESDTTPTNGTLSLDFTANGTGVKQEMQYSVDEISGFDTGTFHDTAQQGSTSSGTALNLADLGTIDAGDLVYAAFGFEGETDSLAAAAGSTQHILRQSGGNVRSLIVITSTTDDTPGVTWGTSGNGCGGVGFVVNAAAAGGGGFGRPLAGYRNNPIGLV